MLRHISLFSAHGAERRWAPLVWALLARGGVETADSVPYWSERPRWAVARPHMVHRNGILSVLSGDRERRRAPEEWLDSDSEQLSRGLMRGRTKNRPGQRLGV